MTNDWSELYNCSDPNNALNCFIDRLTLIHDQCFKFITVKSRNSDSNKKWISSGLIKSINRKCKLYKKWIKTRKKCDETKYKNYQKLLRKTLFAAEKQYYNNLFDTRAQSSKIIWKNINSLINYKQLKNTRSLQIVRDNIKLDDPEVIANAFSSYFCEIGERLSHSNIYFNNNNVSFDSFLKSPMQNSFYCANISMSELIETVKKLKTSKTLVANCLSSFLLKASINSIAKLLLFICNLSIDTGIFPDQLKITRVIPIHKKGSMTDISNYRPISLTNPISKVIEKVLYTRVISFLEKYNILYDFQYGFRKNRSTALAVLDVINMIQSENFNGNYVMGVFMDLQKAFDTVNIQILLAKLDYYGFRGVFYNWFKSYLTDRPQYTFVNGCQSSYKYSEYGIPQGTVLGPLLFLIYINDISNALIDSHIKLFADDSNLFIVNKNINDLYIQSNRELSALAQWIQANKLYINYEKTNYMLFEPHNRPNVLNSNISNAIVLDGHQIGRIKVVKYLGVFINEKLTWAEHIDYLIGKVSSLSGILYRNKIFLPSNCKRNIYFALIHSNITYCIEVYANVSNSVIHPLIVKCNRLLRSLQIKPRTTPLFELYSAYNTLPIDLLFEYYTLKFMHKSIHNSQSMPINVQNWFVRGSTLHSHNTRHKDQFIIQSKYNHCSLLFYGPSMWAKLPLNLQNEKSLHSFLKIIKQSFLISLNKNI